MGQGPPRERGSDADQRGGGTCTCWGLLVQGVVTGCPRKGLGWHTGLRVPGSVPSCCSCARHPKTLELSGGGRAVPGSGQPWAASPCSASFPHKGPGWHYLKLPAGSTSSCLGDWAFQRCPAAGSWSRQLSFTPRTGWGAPAGFVTFAGLSQWLAGVERRSAFVSKGAGGTPPESPGPVWLSGWGWGWGGRSNFASPWHPGNGRPGPWVGCPRARPHSSKCSRFPVLGPAAAPAVESASPGRGRPLWAPRDLAPLPGVGSEAWGASARPVPQLARVTRTWEVWASQGGGWTGSTEQAGEQGLERLGWAPCSAGFLAGLSPAQPA